MLIMFRLSSHCCVALTTYITNGCNSLPWQQSIDGVVIMLTRWHCFNALLLLLANNNNNIVSTYVHKQYIRLRIDIFGCIC